MASIAMKKPNPTPPAALVLIATNCRYCPPVLDALTRLVKDGVIGQLEVINIAYHPEKGRELGVRSTPWTRIGAYELAGRYSGDELLRWATLAATDSGFSDYFTHLLENRNLDKVIETVQKRPDSLEDLIGLLESLDTPMALRIGVGAAIEELQEHSLLLPAIHKLIELTMSDQPQIRADACHYLGLTGSSKALPAVQSLLTDQNSEVREIAAETFAILENNI
jgi:hypothetical protein